MTPISLDYQMAGSFADAVAAIKESLKAAGFGTLSEIDVQATLREKIGAEVEPYTILGVCNPNLAHKALGIEPKIGVFLPCTVVVRQVGDSVLINAQDPAVMEQFLEIPALEPIAQEARARIAGALEGVALTSE